MGGATKRIPVSEETWKELGKEKEPGQTWDELLKDLNIEAEKAKLVETAHKMEDGEIEGVPLDDV
ncbi:MAG: hypothetical protein MUP63_03575 [Candidatus Nanohaloarchaeota archaeon QJJ-7]|nr:hypothetical protein [Candidatus Nanohaloarchaeota archaeon QJJ-7]